MAAQGGQGRLGGQEGQFERPVFNQEELRVLRECNRESFYFRSVPLATALSTAAFLAMKRGILQPSSRFGYTPKVIGAMAIGYFVGKISYQNACAEKIMALPNSPLGEALRKRKGRMGFQETLGMEAGFSLGPTHTETEPTTQPIFDDHRPDIRDHNEGLDDYHRGVTQSLTPYLEESTGAPNPPTTYQELRRQNREEYANKMAEKYRRPPSGDGTPDFPQTLPGDSSPLATLPPTPPPSPSSTASRPVRKNQYGDDVYE